MRRALLLAMALLAARGPLAAAEVAADGSAQAVFATRRWEAFVQQVQRQALHAAPEKLMAAACRNTLLGSPPLPLDAAVDRCIGFALSLIDEESSHTPAAQWRKERADVSSFASVGLELAPKKAGEPLTVVEPIPGSPADRADVRPGDQVLEVDGQDLRPLDREQAIERLRGETDSSVELTLQRPGVEAPMHLTFRRERVRLVSVVRRAASPEVVYLRIRDFQERTPEEFLKRLREVVLVPEGVPRGLVLDLRGNGGGLLDSVVQVGGLFSGRATPVVVLNKREGKEPLDRSATRSPLQRVDPVVQRWLLAVPVVVLVDWRTFSGAEALAQFLREQAGARLVGVSTGGLAMVRTRSVLAGESMLELVSAELVSPGGVRWSKKGLTPDDEMNENVPTADFGQAHDPGLKKALQVVQAMPPREPRP